MSDALILLTAGGCGAVIGGITARRFGHLWGVLAVEAVCLVAKYGYGAQFRLDPLTLDDPTVRSSLVIGASVSMAFTYATLPAALGCGTWFLLGVWTLIFYVSSWGFVGVVASVSGLAYLMGARLSNRDSRSSNSSMPQSSPPSFQIREAELRDLPRITAVCLDGLPDDPTFDYLWRHRHKYPDDNHFFWQQSFKADLFNPRKTVLVAEELSSESESSSSSPSSPMAGKDHEDRREAVSTIVAFAVWELNGVSPSRRTTGGSWSGLLNHLHRFITTLENWAVGKEYVRRDGDAKRIEAFTKTMKYVQSTYWEEKYPQNYHLVLLVTHSKYRRRGAGTLLTKWGIERGLAAGINIGVEASPMGFSLYKPLGFVLLDELQVRADDEDVTLPVKVMVYDKGAESVCN